MSYIVRKVRGFSEGKEGGPLPSWTSLNLSKLKKIVTILGQVDKRVMTGRVTDGVTADRRGLGEKKENGIFLPLTSRSRTSGMGRATQLLQNIYIVN